MTKIFCRLFLCLFTLILFACISQSIQRNTASESITFNRADFVLAGPYQITPEALDSKYNKLPLARFGTFQATLPNQKIYLMRELHYRLYEPKIDLSTTYLPVIFSKTDRKKESFIGLGIRALPVVNGAYRDAQVAPKGKLGQSETEINGSEIVDDFLYQFFGYKDRKKEEPIFALLAYSHPENFKMDFFSAAKLDQLKTENSITHLGFYLGRGQTRNSPYEYHEFTWRPEGYPPIVFSLNYDGADTRTFNQNALIAMKVLNEFNGGPQFSYDYMKDFYRAETLKENLDFYRAWIDTSWIRPEDKENGDTRPFFEKLTTDTSWKTYCAEHVTIALNVALNVPQNLAGFQSVYGNVDGENLWKILVQKWSERPRIPMAELTPPTSKYEPVTMDGTTGLPTDLTLVREGAMTPLWKKSGIISLPGKGIYSSAKIRKEGYSLAWAPETTADLISDYITQYGDFIEGSPALTSTLIIGFSQEAMVRTGLDFHTYFKYVSRILPNLFMYHTAYTLSRNQNDPTEEDIKNTYLQHQAELKIYLTRAFPGQIDHFMTAATTLTPQTVQFIQNKTKEYRRLVDLTSLKNWVRQEYNKSIKIVMTEAKKQRIYEPDIEKQIERGIKLIQYYSPPAILYRISNGLHEKNPHIQVAPIATVFDAKEIEKRNDNQSQVSFPMQ